MFDFHPSSEKSRKESKTSPNLHCQNVMPVLYPRRLMPADNGMRGQWKAPPNLLSKTISNGAN